MHENKKSLLSVNSSALSLALKQRLSQLGNSPYWWGLICLLHYSAHSNLQLALCFLLIATQIKRLTKIIFDSKQSRVFKNWSIWVAIGNKTFETVYSNSVTSENKTIHLPPSPHLFRPFKVGVFCCFLQAAWTAAQHCIEGMGEEKLYFLLLKSIKRPKGPLGQSVLPLPPPAVQTQNPEQSSEGNGLRLSLKMFLLFSR